MSIFLIDDLTVVDLISASPFFNITDDPVSGNVYIYSQKYTGHGKKYYMRESSGLGRLYGSSFQVPLYTNRRKDP